VYSSSNPVEIAPSLSCFQPEQLFNTYIVESNFPGPFLNPYRMVIDQQGNFYVSEFTYHSIKKVTPNGVISTFAGNTSRGYVDGVGTAAQFDYILSMAIDSKGNIYVSDIKSVIRKVTPGGVVTTYAGNGKTGGDDGLAQDATFQMIEGLAVDASGNVYASEPSSGKIRKITPTGIVTTLVSTGLSKPIGLAVNGTYLYVCDQGTHQIKRVSLSSGAVSVYAGTGQKRDGSTHSYVRQANLATFSEPTEITFDKNGNLFVIERNTRYIYKISPTGIVKLGLNQQPIPFKSYISDKQGIALGPDGYIYTTELNGGGITKLSTYSIDKPLPQGLVFDYTTGIIRGTPTAPSPATEYTVYSCDNNKIYSTKITIAVKSLKKSSEEIFTNNEATNIEDNSFEEEENQVIVLEVYPNPARAERTINIGVKGLSRHDLNSSSLKIYSQMGTEVLSLNDLEDENQVRLPASGMYVAQLLSNKGTIVKTILLID
jgi:streptogramin lyase